MRSYVTLLAVTLFAAVTTNADAFSSQSTSSAKPSLKQDLVSKAKRKDTFGSWSHECKNAHCFISQVLVARKNKKIGVIGGVSVAIASKQQAVLTLRFNKNAKKEAGLGLKIDNNKAIRTKILNCDAKVCETNIVMDTQMIEELTSGKRLQVVFINNSTGKQTTLPFSLQGFAKAYGKLTHSNA